MKEKLRARFGQLEFVKKLLITKLSNRQFLILGALLVGLWAGITTVLLKLSVHYLQDFIISLGIHYSWVYLISPAIGILLTFLFISVVLKGDLTKGTYHVLLAIAKKSSFLPHKETYTHAITSALTVGLGGSAGLESPIVQTGSAIGSTFASFFSMSFRDRTLLLACGASAGIAAAFNAPIAGVLFALEVLLVDVSISAFIPLLIAGATGALCSKIILYEDILFSFKSTIEFNYHNVPYYILLGIACGLLSAFYIKSFSKIELLFKEYIKMPWLKLVTGSLLLGLLIMFFPALFGEGYSAVKSLAGLKPESLFEGSLFSSFFTQAPWILGLAILLIGVIKVFAVSLTINAGGNGGNFAPSLLVGACLGFSFAFLFNELALTNLPISNFCLVAMAGVLTGIFHAPLTAIFLIAEITGGYNLMIPLMITTALSTAVSRFIQRHSLDEAKLKEASSVDFDKDSHILSDLIPSTFIETDFVVVPLHSSLRVLVDAVAHSKRNIFPVTDNEGKLVGIIALENIREIMFDITKYDTVLVDQLLQSPIATAQVHEDMSSLMEKFDKTGVWNIPVVDVDKYVGFISKSSIFTNYRERLKSE